MKSSNISIKSGLLWWLIMLFCLAYLFLMSNEAQAQNSTETLDQLERVRQAKHFAIERPERLEQKAIELIQQGLEDENPEVLRNYLYALTAVPLTGNKEGLIHPELVQ